MAQVRVFVGPDRWMLQRPSGEIYWLDTWAIEAIAVVIRQVDDLGSAYKFTLESMDDETAPKKKTTKRLRDEE
jgi:hypothetical protein